MGCTTSTETGEPSKSHLNPNPNLFGTMNRQKFMDLNDHDRERIALILDYWYDEGAKDGSGGHSMNYHERMLNLRQGVVGDHQNEEQQENPQIIQKITSSQENKQEQSNLNSKQKLSTPSNISTNDHSDANASQSKQEKSFPSESNQIESNKMVKSESANITPVINQQDMIDGEEMEFSQQSQQVMNSMQRLHSVPQKIPDLSPEEQIIVDDTSNATPVSFKKKLRLVPSSANSNRNGQGTNSPSKSIYLDGANNNIAETQENDILLNSMGVSKLGDVEESLGVIQRGSIQKLAKWDRNSKMPPQMMKRWFGGGPQTDTEITLLFKQDLIDIGHHKVTHWQGDRMGKLATIILCDQLSRNIFRGFAEAFSFDHISLKLSKQIISSIDTFNSYALFEKLFIIAPLMHSEDVSDCSQCVEVLQEIIDQLKSSPRDQPNQNNDELCRTIEMNKRWCLEHLDILQTFKRYPHRNKVLGRENTEEEDLYLRDAASFGQNNR